MRRIVGEKRACFPFVFRFAFCFLRPGDFPFSPRHNIVLREIGRAGDDYVGARDFAPGALVITSQVTKKKKIRRTEEKSSVLIVLKLFLSSSPTTSGTVQHFFAEAAAKPPPLRVPFLSCRLAARGGGERRKKRQIGNVL